jgi:hypothetical protein
MGFVLQGMKLALAQAPEWWQGAVLISITVMTYSQKLFYL